MALEDLVSGFVVVGFVIAWAVGKAYLQRRAVSAKPSEEFSGVSVLQTACRSVPRVRLGKRLLPGVL